MILVIANWKCNPPTLTKAKELFNVVERETKNIKRAEVVICPPYPYISYMANPKTQTLNPKIGAQDCFWEQLGPYTGEVSPKMLKDLGCQYVIIGHSERRNYFKETDEIINKKLKAALKVNLRPILCVGENKGQDPRRIIGNQLKRGLKGIAKNDLAKIMIAYEPIWAIGTGNFCSAAKAKEVREFIKEKLDNKVLYGGSVNSKIAKDYIKVGFDGLLVGGASLDGKEFIKIIKEISKIEP